MSILRAMIAGLGCGAGYPRMVLGLWLVNLVVALPAAWVVTASIRASIGASRVHETMTRGFDMGWFGEYRAAAEGIETTFTPTVVGPGAFFNNFEGWLTGTMFEGFAGLVGLGLLYMLVWALLLGGVLERFVRPAETRSTARFLRSGGRFFFRFVRLALISGLLYFLVYRFHGWLYERLEYWTRDLTAERLVFLYALAALGLTAMLLVLVHLSFTYAKVATVTENRRSMLLAALRGIGFVLSHPRKTLGLYLGLTLLSVALLALYAWIAPGAGQSTTAGVAFAFLVGQLFLVARLVIRLSLLGGAVALYQSVNP